MRIFPGMCIAAFGRCCWEGGSLGLGEILISEFDIVVAVVTNAGVNRFGC